MQGTITVQAAAPDFGVSLLSPLAVTIFQGQTAVTFKGSVNAVNGYNNTVTLSCQGNNKPTNICSPSPSSHLAPFSFAVSANSTATGPGDYPFTIQGSDGTLTHSSLQAATLHVVDLGISATNPTTVSGFPGSMSTQATFTVSSSGPSFNGTVNINCSNGLPANATCNLSNNAIPLAASQTSSPITLSVNIPSGTSPGDYVVTLSANTSSGGTASPTRTRTFTLSVQDFNIVLNANSIPVLPTGIAHFVGSLAALNGYNNGVVNVACQNLASPETCPQFPTSIPPGTFDLTVTDIAAIPKVYNFTVKADANDGNTHSVPASLQVVDFQSTVPQPNQLTLISSPAGGSVSTAVMGITPVGQFPNPLSLNCSNLPAGVTCTFYASSTVLLPAEVAVVFTAQPNAPASAAVPVNVNASVTIGGLTLTRTQTVSVAVNTVAGTGDLKVNSFTAPNLNVIGGAPPLGATSFTLSLANTGTAGNSIELVLGFEEPVSSFTAPNGVICNSVSSNVAHCFASATGQYVFTAVPGFGRLLRVAVTAAWTDVADSNPANNLGLLQVNIRPIPEARPNVPPMLP